jgi:FtsZ-binding cell division protein ZapB
MQPFEKLKDRLNDALDKIEISLETELENRENDSSLETLISENEGLKRQVDSLKAELSNLREEREQEKKELQSLYDQLSAALAASGETV